MRGNQTPRCNRGWGADTTLRTTVVQDDDMLIEKVLYRAQVTATGGRDTRVLSSDGVLDLKLTTPRELGGANGRGTNPEQLFAAGWSACFEGAIAVVAHKKKIKLLAEVAIDAEVDLHLDDGAYFLSARLNVSIPGIERSIAQGLVDDAKGTCPYSKATRGNIAVTYNVV